MPLTLIEARNTLNFKLKPWQMENAAFQVSELDQAVAEAVTAYSRVKPLRSIVDLIVVANQAVYSFPAGVLRVHPCFFTEDDLPIMPLDVPPGVWYQAVIKQQHASRFFLKRVEVDEYRQKIILHPVPSKNITGKIIVDNAHVLNVENTAYESIPDMDKPFILNYAQAILLRLLADAYSLNSNDVGDRKNRGLNLADYLQSQAKKLQGEFNSRFKMPVAERT
jgi:hypothetical protein